MNIYSAFLGNPCIPIAQVGVRRRRSPLTYFEDRKSALILQEGALTLEKSALFVCIYGLNPHSKCSFKSILEKNINIFQCGALLLYVVNEMFIEVPLFQETSPAPTNSWLRACIPLFKGSLFMYFLL